MAIHLGPRSSQVYASLRTRILAGSLPVGALLPSCHLLAEEFRVAPGTVRHALARLQEEGLVSREKGRGFFVQRRSVPAVLVVDDEPVARAYLHAIIARDGLRVLEAGSPAEALALLEKEPSMDLVLSDIRMPLAADGIDFLRTVRRRWPGLPLVAVSAYPDDLAELHGTPDHPILVITKPVHPAQVEEVLRLALTTPRAARVQERLPVLVADDEPSIRAALRALITDEGYEVEEVKDGYGLLEALQRRRFGHVFMDLRMPGGGIERAQAITDTYPDTAVVLVTGYVEDIYQSADRLFMVIPKPFDAQTVQAALRIRLAPVARRVSS